MQWLTMCLYMPQSIYSMGASIDCHCSCPPCDESAIMVSGISYLNWAVPSTLQYAKPGTRNWKTVLRNVFS